MSDHLRIRIIFENKDGEYRDGKHEFRPEDFGGVPAVGDVIISPWLPPVNEDYQEQGGFWEVVTRYFKPSDDPSDNPYVALVVRERSRGDREIGI